MTRRATQAKLQISDSRTAWNKGRKVGQKKGFTKEQVQRIAQRLEGNLMEGALFHTAIDTMFRASDLLPLTVADITTQNGDIKDCLCRDQQKTSFDVTVALLPPTKDLLKQLIQIKYHPTSALFTMGSRHTPLSENTYRRLVKKWASYGGITNTQDYSGHSTRRTKAMYLYTQGVDIAKISRALGHKTISATLRYLGIEVNEIVEELKKHEMWGE